MLSDQDVLQQAVPLLAPVAIVPQDVQLLTQGATSRVWRVRSDAGHYVLRVFKDSGRVLDGSVDAFLRQEIYARGGAVVVPILNSETSGQLLRGNRWCLDSFVEGVHPPRGVLTQQICHTLGQTLATLHNLPTRQFGRPAGIVAGKIMGQVQTPLQGVAQRFENPLPELWARDFVHPVLSEWPKSAKVLHAHFAQVSSQMAKGEAVVCHSDLHEKQMICARDDLIALIDFGDATLLDRHWDFGSLLYFHGTGVFDQVRSSYRDHSTAPISASLSTSFAIAVAMHHASRSRIPGKAHRLRRAIEFIQRCVEYGYD